MIKLNLELSDKLEKQVIASAEYRCMSVEDYCENIVKLFLAGNNSTMTCVSFGRFLTDPRIKEMEENGYSFKLREMEDDNWIITFMALQMFGDENKQFDVSINPKHISSYAEISREKLFLGLVNRIYCEYKKENTVDSIDVGGVVLEIKTREWSNS